MQLWPGGPELRIAGVPLRVSPLFLFVALFAAWGATRGLDDVRIAPTPPMPSTDDLVAFADWVERYGTPELITTRPGPGYLLAVGLAVVLVFALSILLHELGHLFAARALGAEPTVIELNLFGGFVELADTDRIRPSRRALIVAAGPAATLVVLIAAAVVAGALGNAVDEATPLGIAIDRVAAYAIGLNAVALFVNLLPVRPLDGGQLLAALRGR